MSTSMKDRFRERAAAAEHEGGGRFYVLPKNITPFKPKKGTQKIDIVPYVVSDEAHPEKVPVGDTWMRRQFYAHFNVGPNQDAFVCPRTVNQACPICEEYRRLSKDPDIAEEVAAALRPKKRELYNVLNEDGSVSIFDISYHNFGKTLEKEVQASESDQFSGFAELKDGYTLKVRWDETTMGKGKPFLQAGRVDFLEREALAKSTLDDVADLDSLFKVPTYEELESAMHGGKAAAKPAAEDGEAPRGRKLATEEDADPAPRRRAVEPEAEETPRRKVAAEEDADPAPRRKVAAEEDADPAPRRRVVEEDAPAPRRKAVAEEDAAPAPRRRVVEEDAPAPRRKAVAD